MVKSLLTSIIIVIVFVSSLSYAGTKIFSEDANDYEASINIINDGENWQYVFYGKMNTGFKFSELPTFAEQYGSSAFPTYGAFNLDSFRDEIKDYRVIVWYGPGEGAPIFSICDKLSKNTAKESFRCVETSLRWTIGKTREQILADQSGFTSPYWFRAAKTGADDSPHIGLNAWISAGSADADTDGVPDAFDNCPSASNYDQADTNVDGVGDVCVEELPPQVEGEAEAETETTEADVVSGEGVETSTIEFQQSGSGGKQFDEGGFCSLMSNQATNPSCLALILTAAVALMRRRSG